MILYEKIIIISGFYFFFNLKEFIWFSSGNNAINI
jgi:hypothetical protein